MASAKTLPEYTYTEQTNPPHTPAEKLPDMYDLPSEDPEEPGLPDEFHSYQPYLLQETFCPPDYPPDRIFTIGNMNLYYDVRHTEWHKRPDWFAVVDVPRFYGKQKDLRNSYVIWQEGVIPFIAVELLSDGTEQEDLGESPRLREINQMPNKWEVYERILGIPHYVVFDRHTGKLRAFSLDGGFYRELDVSGKRIWFPEIKLGLGLWEGRYQDIELLWLRWYNASDVWVPTLVEAAKQRAEEAKQRADQETLRADQETLRADQAKQRADQENPAGRGLQPRPERLYSKPGL
ncbi:MAG: Uma2 family endonuclease [Gammaproteobacteria bacterium]|nr:Uma2 family endonuclease [Gammaproteobacteria bacterium]